MLVTTVTVISKHISVFRGPDQVRGSLHFIILNCTSSALKARLRRVVFPFMVIVATKKKSLLSAKRNKARH